MIVDSKNYYNFKSDSLPIVTSTNSTMLIELLLLDIPCRFIFITLCVIQLRDIISYIYVTAKTVALTPIRYFHYIR